MVTNQCSLKKKKTLFFNIYPIKAYLLVVEELNGVLNAPKTRLGGRLKSLIDRSQGWRGNIKSGTEFLSRHTEK